MLDMNCAGEMFQQGPLSLKVSDLFEKLTDQERKQRIEAAFETISAVESVEFDDAAVLLGTARNVAWSKIKLRVLGFLIVGTNEQGGERAYISKEVYTPRYPDDFNELRDALRGFPKLKVQFIL